MVRVYVDMDDVLCDYSGEKARQSRLSPEVKYPQSIEGFFLSLAPLPEALESIAVLVGRGFQVYVLTAPSTHNPLSYMEKRIWVERYLGFEFVERLIICSDKSLLMGDYLVDDNKFGKGQEMFKGELIHFGSERFPNWKRVAEYLEGTEPA